MEEDAAALRRHALLVAHGFVIGYLTEFLLLVITVAAAGVLLRPFVARVPSPGWLERARLRGRPGIPVVSWLGAALLMGVAWLIGERRGLFGTVLLLVWVGAPLTALGISVSWRLARRRRRP